MRSLSLLALGVALSCAIPVCAAVTTAENDYYVVVVDPARNGAYSVATGPLHPVTVDQGTQSNVLRGGFNEAGISFNSVRSYGSASDYFLGLPRFLHTTDPDFNCVVASDTGLPSVEMVSEGGQDVGVRMTWSIDQDGDELLVEQLVVARGEEFTDSLAEVTLSVTNVGATDALLGIRYAWHLILGNRGGAAFPTIGMKSPEPPTEPYYNNEQSLPYPDYRSYVVSLEDTPSNPGPLDDNEYVVEATLRGVPLVPPPTPPDSFLFTLFGEEVAPSAVERFGPLNSCFAYEIGAPPRVVYRASGTGVVYFWGATQDTAIVVLPGETASVTQYVFAYLDFPLVCNAGAPQTVECAGPATSVELDGSGSTNLVNADLEYLWTSDDPAILIENETSARPLVHVSDLGAHSVELLVHRGGFATSCSTEVEVVDTTPPTVERAVATPSSLWPPNHRLVPVEVSLNGWDLCAESLDIRLVEARSNEPSDVRRGGDGHTSDDIQEAEIGTADFSVLLRAERQGGRVGRTYTLLYEVRDGSGNVSTVPVTVSVSHDQRPSRRR